MISNSCNYRKVSIQITTYRNHLRKQQTAKNMNSEKEIAKRFTRTDDNTKFICSICLNAKPKCDFSKKSECNKRKSKSCPICQRGFDLRLEGSTENKQKPNKCEAKEKTAKALSNHFTSNTKTVQTSQTDVTQGLSLLNEVLTVFQSKKQLNIEKEKCGKTVIVKDASVETENLLSYKGVKTKLTVSKVFHLSIEDTAYSANNKFTIVNCSQPQTNKKSQYSIDLIKHKSSSIPQMKLEELKNSFKEKIKSKDTIEEVNRMFATVRKNAGKVGMESLDDTNRPMIRNGPRVLPVVKTKTRDTEYRNRIHISDDISRGHRKLNEKKNCKFCQTNSYFMSSGDSLINPDNQLKRCDQTCGKCIHMMRCHKHGCHQVPDVCEHCCKRCMENSCRHNCYDDIHDGDSCASF